MDEFLPPGVLIEQDQKERRVDQDVEKEHHAERHGGPAENSKKDGIGHESPAVRLSLVITRTYLYKA